MASTDQVVSLWEEVRELSLGSSGQVQRIDSPVASLQFLRDFVSPNKPCIISNAIQHWPALSLWSSDEYLLQALSNTEISLHLTPNGRADSLVPHPSDPSSLCFASAHVQRMPFCKALPLITNSGKDKLVVAYAQQQNNCFQTEYKALAIDCDSHIDWASEALGCHPEAVNLWIGNDLSKTSFHKDHYENLYAVVTGEKEFLLMPPTDVHRLYIHPYPAAQYIYLEVSVSCSFFTVVNEAVQFTLAYFVVDQLVRLLQDSGEFSLEVEDPVRHVPWCSVNPHPSLENEEKERNDYPLFFNGPKPFKCTVKAGEILYLPSMWYHYVKQTPDSRGRTIAVNYWYDMQFDIKYAYFNFLQSIYHPLPQNHCNEESRGEQGGRMDPRVILMSEDQLKMHYIRDV